MSHTDKHRPSGPSSPLKKREKLEFIIDTCSAGHQVMRATDRLIDYAMQAEQDGRSRIFDDYRITMPIQIGTERKRRIFPEFLEAELLSDAHGDLEQFFQRHHTHVHLAETPTSRGFKLYYSFKAIDVLEKQPELKQNILRDATLLAQKYAPYLDIDTTKLDSAHLERFLEHISTAYDAHQTGMEEPTQNLVALHRDSTSDLELQHIIRKAEHVRITREAKPFLKELSIEEKLLMQAMYSCNPLNVAVSRMRDFQRYRADKGERAIEEFLFDKRAESDPDRVTVIVSEDQGARKSIQRLRDRSHNTVFAISSYGLAHATCALTPELNLLDLLDTAGIDLMQRRDAGTEDKIRNGKSIGMDDVVEPRIEEKWADRLVQVLKSGQWENRKIELD